MVVMLWLSGERERQFKSHSANRRTAVFDVPVGTCFEKACDLELSSCASLSGFIGGNCDIEVDGCGVDLLSVAVPETDETLLEKGLSQWRDIAMTLVRKKGHACSFFVFCDCFRDLFKGLCNELFECEQCDLPYVGEMRWGQHAP